MTKPIFVRTTLRPEDKEQLDQYCRITDRSVSYVVRQALQSFLAARADSGTLDNKSSFTGQS